MNNLNTSSHTETKTREIQHESEHQLEQIEFNPIKDDCTKQITSSKDVYSIVTEKIIAMLEAGTIAWRKSWRGGDCPRNLVNKKRYRGINALILGLSEFESPYWLTFNQTKELGGKIKKGAKSEIVVFWKFFDRGEESESNKARSDDSNSTKDRGKRPPILRYYRVFNIEQTEGLERFLPEKEEREDRIFAPIERAAKIIEEMPECPLIQHKEQSAYYSPSMDYVNLPRPETFNCAESYYATAFHELTHSTGHKSRLDRAGVAGDRLAPFGSGDYSREELIAEIGSAFLCAEAGIENTLENSAAYLNSWLRVLKGDSKMIVTAAGAAQRAVDFILGADSTSYAEIETDPDT